MDEKLSDEVVQRMANELRAIHSLVDQLHVDDVENDIRNAERCLLEEGRTLEIENIAKNRMYHAGSNHVINEVREILGLPRLYLKGEKERIDREAKDYLAGRQLINYDCPPMKDSEYNMIDGSAKLLILGEDQSTYVVVGTTSSRKAYELMRKYEREECGLDASEGVGEEYGDKPTQLPKGRLVWRQTDSIDYDGYYFSWSDKDTKNNRKAIDCFIVSW